MEIRKLYRDEVESFMELILLFEDVFEMKDFKMPDKNHLDQLLKQNGFYVFAAYENSEVIAGLTAYTMDQYYNTLPLVYIFDLAVKREFQRQGIGRSLINAINDYCKKTGVQEVFVQADEVDDYALDFYRSTGARGEKVVHFYYPLNSPE